MVLLFQNTLHHRYNTLHPTDIILYTTDIILNTTNFSIFSGGGVAQLVLGRGAGLVIERLRNLSSTSDAVAHRCVFGKDT